MLGKSHRRRVNAPVLESQKTITKAQSGSPTPAPSGTGFFREDGMEIAEDCENREDWIDELSDEELEKELNQMESYYRNLGVID